MLQAARKPAPTVIDLDWDSESDQLALIEFEIFITRKQAVISTDLVTIGALSSYLSENEETEESWFIFNEDDLKELQSKIQESNLTIFCIFLCSIM